MAQDIDSIEFSDPIVDFGSCETYAAPVAQPPETDLAVSLRTLFSLFD